MLKSNLRSQGLKLVTVSPAPEGPPAPLPSTSSPHPPPLATPAPPQLPLSSPTPPPPPFQQSSSSTQFWAQVVLTYENGYIFTWMLQQIFRYSDKVILAAGQNNVTLISPPFTLSPLLLLDKRTDQSMRSILSS